MVTVLLKETKWQKKRQALRDELWPDAKDVVFSTTDGGYCRVVPRIVPLVCVLANHVKERAGDLAAAYVDLWLRTDNDGFVEIDDELECAASSGFLGGRALWSWRERIRELERLGLIRIKGEGHRQIRYVLLVRPDDAVAQIVRRHAKSVPKVWQDYYARRSRDIGAKVRPAK